MSRKVHTATNLTDIDLCRKQADRKNKRNARRWPLLALAGQLEQVTGEEMQAKHAAWLESFAAGKARAQAAADAYRTELARHVTPEQLAKIDQARSTYPPSAEYASSHYLTHLARVLGRTPLEIYNEFERAKDGPND